MKMYKLIAMIFISIIAMATVTEGFAKGSSSRSSSSSSRSSSSSSYSKSYSSSSSSKPSTSTTSSSYTKSYSSSTPTTTPSTSTYTKSYGSTPTTSSNTSKSTSSTSYGGTTTKQTYTAPNPNFTPPTRQTATNTTVVNNRTVIYSQGAGGNGSTFMDSMIGTMAGMAIYDMITDDKGNQVKVEQYYVSGEQRIPVGTGSVTPKTVTQTVPDEPTDWSVFFKWFFGISATVIFLAILGSMFSSSNRY